MEGAGTERSQRRSSAALIVSILALAAASGGTAVAVGGFTDDETKTIKKIANRQASPPVTKVFKRIAVDDAGVLITKGAGFKIRATCLQSQVNAYLVKPDGVAWDGVSDVDTVFANQTPLDLNATGGGFQVSSFAVATEDGRVLSGNLGFDYPGASGTFDGQNKCVVYGHVLVN